MELCMSFNFLLSEHFYSFLRTKNTLHMLRYSPAKFRKEIATATSFAIVYGKVSSIALQNPFLSGTNKYVL